jgi:ribosomal protein S10
MHNLQHMRKIFTPFVRRVLRLLATVSLMPWLLLASVNLQAQLVTAAGSPTAPMPTAASAAATPIAVPDILNRADEDQQRVDRAKRLLEAADPAERLARELDEIASPVDVKLNATGGGTLRSLPVMRLESLARHWEFDARRFAQWEARSQRALAPCSWRTGGPPGSPRARRVCSTAYPQPCRHASTACSRRLMQLKRHSATS